MSSIVTNNSKNLAVYNLKAITTPVQCEELKSKCTKEIWKERFKVIGIIALSAVLMTAMLAVAMVVTYLASVVFTAIVIFIPPLWPLAFILIPIVGIVSGTAAAYHGFKAIWKRAMPLALNASDKMDHYKDQKTKLENHRIELLGKKA